MLQNYCCDKPGMLMWKLSSWLQSTAHWPWNVKCSDQNLMETNNPRYSECRFSRPLNSWLSFETARRGMCRCALSWFGLWTRGWQSSLRHMKQRTTRELSRSGLPVSRTTAERSTTSFTICLLKPFGAKQIGVAWFFILNSNHRSALSNRDGPIVLLSELHIVIEKNNMQRGQGVSLHRRKKSTT